MLPSRHQLGRALVAASLLLGATVPTAAAATKIEGGLVVASGCDRLLAPAADCVIDALGRGTFSVRGSSKPGDGGVAFQVRLAGAQKDDDAVDVAAVRVAFMVSVDGGGCTTHFSPAFDLVGGGIKGSLEFGGGDASPALAASAGSSVELCGDRVAVVAPGAGGDEIVAVDGVRQGPSRQAKRLRGNVVLEPGCDPVLTPGAECSVAVGRGRFAVRGSRKGEHNGLAFKIALARMFDAGAAADRDNVRVVFSLSIDGGSCFDFFSPKLTIVKGRLRGGGRFDGGSTLPAATASPGSSVELCGNGVRVFVPGSNGSDVVGVAGLVAGE